MSEPLSREELEEWLIRTMHSYSHLLARTALHYLDRVAELEKERDEVRNHFARCRIEDKSRADRAEAGVAAAQEALKRYGRHLRQCAARRGSTRAGELGNRLPCDCGLDDALARGGGHQETGQ